LLKNDINDLEKSVKKGDSEIDKFTAIVEEIPKKDEEILNLKGLVD